jgi:lysozyme family protein
MDFGVNAGTSASIKLLQEAINWVQRGDTLAVDGKIGPNTLHQVNTNPDRNLILKFFELRIRYYADICRRRKASRKFLYAWTRRSLDHV